MSAVPGPPPTPPLCGGVGWWWRRSSSCLALYSRNDGVVDWRSCIDDLSPGARNVEVTSSHLAMGLDPDVWVHLAEWFGA